MITKSMVGIFVLIAAMFFAAENSFAQENSSPKVETGNLLSVNTSGIPDGAAGFRTGGCVKLDPGTKARLILEQKQRIAYLDDLLLRWIKHLNNVVKYFNHATYDQWARIEYARSYQQILAIFEHKANYQKRLREIEEM